eukprot:Rhum_TRINITY_DN14055_c0_g1::Rhum_TRINITY_DN14055_c0_g1_i1::g.68260::m.68260/K02040/pstS; phosphate transport system substrate-binding protein
MAQSLRGGAVAVVVLVGMLAGQSAGETAQAPGSGCKLLDAYFATWLPEYVEDTGKTNVNITYRAIGDRGGLENVRRNVSMWAGSESPLSAEQRSQADGLQTIPVVSSPLALVFQVPGVTTLKLTRGLIARIFSRDVVFWDDAELQAQNMHTVLPHRGIEVAVLGEASGSTVMTASLMSFGWGETSGCRLGGRRCRATQELMSVGIDGYTAVNGSDALASYVRATPFAIGYVAVPSALAQKSQFAIVQNKIDVFSVANAQQAQLAAGMAVYDPAHLTANVEDKIGYPVLGLGYIVYWREVQTAQLGIAGMEDDEHEREEYCESYFAFVEFLHWMYMSTEYEQLTRGLHLAPITSEVSNKVVGKLWGSKCDGKRWKHADSEIVVSVDTELTGATLDILSFFYHRHSPGAVVITQSLAGTRPSLLTIKRTSAVEAAEIMAGKHSSKAHAWLPLCSCTRALSVLATTELCASVFCRWHVQ